MRSEDEPNLSSDLQVVLIVTLTPGSGYFGPEENCRVNSLLNFDTGS